MSRPTIAAADTEPSVIRIGQDAAGHWLVQENHGLMEGSFVSRDAAVRFARWERHAFANAELAFSATPLVSFLAH